SLPDDIHHFLEPADALSRGVRGEHAGQGPVVRQADEQPGSRGRRGCRDLPAPCERLQPDCEGLLQRLMSRRPRPPKTGVIKRRVGHEPESERYDAGHVLPHPDDRLVKVFAAAAWRIGRPEKLLDIRARRAHCGEEQVVLAAETLVEDRLGNAGGVGDLAGGGRMTAGPENLARDAQHFVIGNRFGTGHDGQSKFDSGVVPGRTGQISEHSLIYSALDVRRVGGRQPCLRGGKIMLWTIRAALPMLACSALVLACVASAPADDAKDKPGASGIWAKKEGQLTIAFADKDVLRSAPRG